MREHGCASTAVRAGTSRQNNRTMDLVSDIAQLIQQNARPKFAELSEQQQRQLDDALRPDLDYEALEKQLLEWIQDWKKTEYVNVSNTIGDLQKVDLGKLLAEVGTSLDRLHTDLRRLPRFTLLNNDDEADLRLLQEYNSLRSLLIHKCEVIGMVRHEIDSDVNYQTVSSVASQVDVARWRDEVTLELRTLIQNLETALKLWPSLSAAQKAHLKTLVRSSKRGQSVLEKKKD